MENENEGVQMIVMRKVLVPEGTKQGDTHEFVREVGPAVVVETVVGARVMEEAMLVHVSWSSSGFCSTPFPRELDSSLSPLKLKPLLDK